MIARRHALPPGWLEYAEWCGERGTIAGRVVVRPAVRSPQLGNERDVLVYLPPSLAASGDRDYPIVYMHDGQNLFDAGTSDFGEWHIDETMEVLAADGIEAIVVAVPNAEAAEPVVDHGRWREYSPHVDHRGYGGAGDAYLDFLARTVKPLVDDAFPTRRAAPATGVAGSSMGGVISLRALVARPETFGFAGVISPALWFADGRVLAEDAPRLRPGPRIYLDVGGREGEYAQVPEQREPLSRGYLEDARALRRLFVANGFREGEDLRYVEDLDARHNQEAWARRMPDMFRFLLAGEGTRRHDRPRARR